MKYYKDFTSPTLSFSIRIDSNTSLRPINIDLDERTAVAFESCFPMVG